MKYCEEYLPALSALIDGELSDAERGEVLAHLEACEGCREYFTELSMIHAAFAELEEYDAPEGFSDGVMARVHEAPAPKKRTHRAAWLSIAACAAVAVTVLVSPLREQLGAKSATDDAATEAAMVTMTMAAPQECAEEKCVEEECAEEEYMDTSVSLQSAPRMMMTRGDTESEKSKTATVTGTNDCTAETPLELPRSAVSVYGAAREDYLIEEAVSLDYCADGTVAGYDLPTEKLDEFLALLDAEGLSYESAVAEQATTFCVQYEEENANG